MGCSRTFKATIPERIPGYREAGITPFNINKIKDIDCFVINCDSPRHKIENALESGRVFNSIVKQRKSTNALEQTSSVIPLFQMAE